MARKQCSIEGCEFLCNAKGLCRTHYGRMLRERQGSPTYGSTSYELIDYDDYWLFVKKELNLV